MDVTDRLPPLRTLYLYLTTSPWASSGPDPRCERSPIGRLVAGDRPMGGVTRESTPPRDTPALTPDLDPES